MELKKYELSFTIGLLIKRFNFHRELKRDSRVVDAYIILEGGRIHLLAKELDGQTNYMDNMPCLLLKFT